MRKIHIFIGILLTMVAVSGYSTSLDSLRTYYFDEWVGKCGAEKLVAYTDGIDEEASPLIKAYRGAGLATTSNCTSWPLSKLSRFREGKGLLEEAVSIEPENLEVRFLRYTIQKNIPDFLGYDNLEEDRQFIMERLTLQLKKGTKDDLTKRIIQYLLETKEITEEQLKDLEAAMVNQ